MRLKCVSYQSFAIIHYDRFFVQISNILYLVNDKITKGLQNDKDRSYLHRRSLQNHPWHVNSYFSIGITCTLLVQKKNFIFETSALLGHSLRSLKTVNDASSDLFTQSPDKNVRLPASILHQFFSCRNS